MSRILGSDVGKASRTSRGVLGYRTSGRMGRTFRERCKWTAAEQLLWLKVRLSRRAQAVFKRFDEADREDVGKALAALKDRFEPKSKKDFYMVEFQCRRKKRTEGWAEYVEDLQTLVDKAFSDLADVARQKIALQNFLQQLTDDKVGFAVRQSKSTTLQEAVTATLEAESFLPKTGSVALVDADEEPQQPIGTTQPSQEVLVQTVRDLSDRLQKLEAAGSSKPELQRRRREWRRPSSGRREGRVLCFKCGQEGHYAHGCASRSGLQGNQ